MYPHHEEAIGNVTAKLSKDPEVLAVLIGGSIAHGFATPASDVDIMIVVADEDQARRAASGAMHYYETESCTYEGGYIDGKYICPGFLAKVAEYGSEPARFAFHGARIAFSRLDGLAGNLAAAARYPAERKDENIKRFYAQLEAWHWYCHEAIKHRNDYLLGVSLSNLVLFGGRLILAHNETLYPYHKWFLRVLDGVESKPAGFRDLLDGVLARKDAASVEAFYEAVAKFTDWGCAGMSWPVQFMADSELTWLEGKAPVGDV